MNKTQRRMLRLPDVMAKTGLKRSSIYAYVKEGKFPAPTLLGVRACGWLEADVDAWIESRIASGKSTATKVLA
ncbi:MAG: AlpA family transcriptional regulator [Alphaproteobacteria bacterium]|nr:AlpA family transcriptional regulator [Alphaproteobacteria bacterium]